MAKVLLIDPPWFVLQDQDNSVASIGLAYLGTYLKSKGHECLIFNGEFGFKTRPQKGVVLVDYPQYLSNLDSNSKLLKKTFEEMEKIIKEFKPSIVGITVPTAKYIVAVKIANKIKQINPKIKIVVGGPHPTVLPEKTLEEDCFDVVIKNEGEVSFYNVVEAIEKNKSLKNIRGISYKKDKKIFNNKDQSYIKDLDTLPFPAWDLFYRWKEFHPDSFGGILTSRGCPYDCTFCASQKIWSRKTRNRTVQNIIKEIKQTHERFKTKLFRINDDTFTLNKKRIVEFCNALIKEDIKIKWVCDTRTNHVDLELLNLMKKAGCFHINLGIESGNPEILKLIKKGINLEEVRKVFKLAKKAKISTTAYFMIGFPTETKEQVMDTIKLMEEIKPDNPCWGIVTPYPGTELYNLAKKMKVLPKKDNYSYYFHHSPDMGLSKNLTKEDINELTSEIQKRLDNIYLKKNFKRKISHFLHPLETSKKIKYRIFSLFRRISFNIF